MTSPKRAPGGEPGAWNNMTGGGDCSVSSIHETYPTRQGLRTTLADHGPVAWAAMDALFTLKMELAADGLIDRDDPRVDQALGRAWHLVQDATYLRG